MNRQDEMKAILENSAFTLSGGIRGLLLLLSAVGLAGFVAGLFSGHPQEAWQSLLVNTIYFCGLSFGALMFSVIWTITDAKWSRSLKRFAEALGAFAPIAGLFFLVLFFGMDHFFQWTDPDQVIHSKEAWLNIGFFVKRNVVLYVLTLIVSWLYIKNSIAPDLALAKKLTGFTNPFAEMMSKGYSEDKETHLKGHKLAIILAILYFLLSTLLAFDWMMSIDQEWFSTMYGVQHLISNLISGACLIMIVAGVARSAFKLEDYISIVRYHDISKFAFAACLLWTYMIFSQVLVIWYGNLPEETPYVILRMQSHEWGWMFWLIMIMVWIFPFFALLGRTSCNSIVWSRIVAVEILIGMWLEKYFLVVPSIQENLIDAAGAGSGHGGSHALGMHYNIFDFSITIGMAGVFLLCFFWFLQRVPVVPIADERFFADGHH